jgi:hypothetical protein
MTRVWNAPIFAIATVYFATDALVSAVTGPITRWLSKKRLLERVRRWVTSLGPNQSFALFAVPVVILEPAKPFLSDRHRPFPLWSDRFHRCGGHQADRGGKAFSAQQEKTVVDTSFCLGIRILGKK